jgi:translation initiation factor 4A
MTDELELYESFEDMDLDEKILRGIFAYGYEKPSYIQQKAIMPFINGNDIIAQAQSGTGKTATFTISMLNNLKLEDNTMQAIILSHTRELALQIQNVIKNISKFMNIKVNLSVGGTQIRDNIEELNQIPHVIIGTPGRVLDMLNKNFINRKTIRMLILDEADELLSRIFVNQIYDIFRSIPSNVQVGLFSATMTPDFFKLSSQFMRDPVKVLIKNEELTLDGIRQFYIDLEKPEYKYATLCDLYSLISVSQSIIYCNSRRIVEILTRKLMDDDFSVAAIHGDMPQKDRNVIMDDFRNGVNRVLISTDLLSRGIDIQQVSVVINYDIPQTVENYIHRIGRSGRFGRKGLAINFVTSYDRNKITELEQYYATEIPALPDLSELNIF